VQQGSLFPIAGHQLAHGREICTFICEGRQSSAFSDLREEYGSKIYRVIGDIERTLRDFPQDKILVFGQWYD